MQCIALPMEKLLTHTFNGVNSVITDLLSNEMKSCITPKTQWLRACVCKPAYDRCHLLVSNPRGLFNCVASYSTSQDVTMSHILATSDYFCIPHILLKPASKRLPWAVQFSFRYEVSYAILY